MKKVVFAVFGIALILGSVSLYLNLKKLDDQYTSLIEEGTSQLKLIQRLSFDSNKSYILSLMILSSSNEKEKAMNLAERSAIADRNTRVLDSLRNYTSEPILRATIDSLIKVRLRYKIKCDEFIEIGIKPEATASLLNEFKNSVDPLFQDYQYHINTLFAESHKTISIANDQYSAQAKFKADAILLLSFFSPMVLVIVGSVLGLFMIFLFLKAWTTDRN